MSSFFGNGLCEEMMISEGYTLCFADVAIVVIVGAQKKFGIRTTYAPFQWWERTISCNYFDSIFMCVRCGFCQWHKSHILVIICNNNNTRRQNVRVAFNITDAARLELDLLYFIFFFRIFAPSYAIALFSRAQHMVFSAIQCSSKTRRAWTRPKIYTTSTCLVAHSYLNILLYFVIP